MKEQEEIWYVIYSKPRWEKKVAKILGEKGIECYCPLNKVKKKWSDRTKVVFEPLFKGYIFVKVSEDKKWDIKKIDGVINYVHWLGKPARVKETEINIVRKFLQEFDDVQVFEHKIEINSKVSIRNGILMNYQGIILQLNGSRATVLIDSMGIKLTAQFDKKNLEASR